VRDRFEVHRPMPVAPPREMIVKHWECEQSDEHKPAVTNEGGKGEGQARHGTHRQLYSSCTRSDRCLVTGKHGTDEWPQLLVYSTFFRSRHTLSFSTTRRGVERTNSSIAVSLCHT
jgi:hypothetical protein